MNRTLNRTFDTGFARSIPRTSGTAKMRSLQDYYWGSAGEASPQDIQEQAASPGLEGVSWLVGDEQLPSESADKPAIRTLSGNSQLTCGSLGPFSLRISRARQLYDAICGWRIKQSGEGRSASHRNVRLRGSKAVVSSSLAGHSAQRSTETFKGKVESIEGDIAHVTLTDEQGRVLFAECDAEDLSDEGITQGGRFRCVVAKRGRQTVATWEAVPKRRLSAEEWRRLREETTEALKDYDPGDDY